LGDFSRLFAIRAGGNRRMSEKTKRHAHTAEWGRRATATEKGKAQNTGSQTQPVENEAQAAGLDGAGRFASGRSPALATLEFSSATGGRTFERTLLDGARCRQFRTCNSPKSHTNDSLGRPRTREDTLALGVSTGWDSDTEKVDFDLILPMWN